MQQIDPTDGPIAGLHNFFRGGPLTVYDTETRKAIAALKGTIDTHAATATWEAALKATWLGPPVWVYGDISPGNLLVRAGQLCAVIDFGGLGVGDPACDLAIAWTLFSGESRSTFRTALDVEDAAWARGRGWALWKALITVAGNVDDNPQEAKRSLQIIEDILVDHAT